jgi:photosystem II stability/assembly factor-like uncharacterized protein
MKNKIILISLLFLSASCNPFRTPTVAGVAKTTNGGVDWTSANLIKDNTATLSGLNVSKMEFDPKNREVVFVAGYNDGLYKSEDSGVTWSRILSKILTYDFVIHPLNSKIIYAGGYFADKGRLVKTEDGGKSWEEVYNEAVGGVSVRTVALNPQLPNQVVLGNSAGSLVYSADGGKSWRLVKNFEDRINKILWQNDALYVLLKTKGLYKLKHMDTGEFEDLTLSLTQQSGFLENFSGLNEQTFNQVYVDKASPLLIYLTAGKGVFKTTSEGKTWEKVSLPGKQSSELPARAITIAKTTSNIVMLSVGKVVYKSTDGAKTWQTQEVNSSGFINYLLIDPQLPQIVYAGNYVNQ